MDRGNPSKPEPAQDDDHTDVATRAAPEFELTGGSTLGEFMIEGRIGEGGMGVVYSAVHPLIGKRAAVKILRAELCRDPAQVARFIDEARAVNQIGHPNIVDVFAFGEMPDGRSYFVMEWLKGESLAQRLQRGPLSVHDACDILRPLSRALEAAHDKGVIHRDLKPDNVFLVDVRDDRPNVKLLDFGIAKLQREDGRRVEKTATGAIVGTPKYIAPEQAKGHAIDARVDVYSLGAIAFEMLAGRSVFQADNAMEMVAKHLMEPAPRLGSLAKVPRELDELVRAMLAKDPAERPALSQVVEVVERVRARAKPSRAATPVPALRPSSPGIPGPRRTLLVAGIAGACVAAVGAFVLVRSLASSPDHGAAPPSPAAVPTPAAVAPEPSREPAAAPEPGREPAAAVAPAPAAVTPTPEPPPVVAPTLPPPAPVPDLKPEPKEKTVKPVTRPRPHSPKPDKKHPVIEIPDDDHGLMESK